MENVDLLKLWSTIEPQHLVEKAYPELVESFTKSKLKPSKRKTKKDSNKENAGNLLNTSEPVIKKIRKPRKTKNQLTEELEILEDSFSKINLKDAKKNLQTIDKFLLKNTVTSSTPMKNTKNCSFNLDMSDFEDENNDNLSEIVDNIINRDIPCLIKDNLKKFKDEYVPEESVEKHLANASSFFITNPVEDDLFEKTFNMKENESDENTIEYDVNEYLQEKIEEYKNLSDDSFTDEYVPLHERLINKLQCKP